MNWKLITNVRVREVRQGGTPVPQTQYLVSAKLPNKYMTYIKPGTGLEISVSGMGRLSRTFTNVIAMVAQQESTNAQKRCRVVSMLDII